MQLLSIVLLDFKKNARKDCNWYQKIMQKEAGFATTSNKVVTKILMVSGIFFASDKLLKPLICLIFPDLLVAQK